MGGLCVMEIRPSSGCRDVLSGPWSRFALISVVICGSNFCPAVWLRLEAALGLSVAEISWLRADKALGEFIGGPEEAPVSGGLRAGSALPRICSRRQVDRS